MSTTRHAVTLGMLSLLLAACALEEGASPDDVVTSNQ